MATRCLIGIKEKGGIRQIYSHWDGYPEHVGLILADHYTTAEKINLLMELGSVSVLRPLIGEKHDFDKPNKQWTLAFGRDRGDEDSEARISKTMTNFRESARDSWVEYLYLFKNNEWFFCGGSNGRFKPLREYLLKNGKLLQTA